VKRRNTQSRIFAASSAGLIILFIAIFSMLVSPFTNALMWSGRNPHYGYFNNQFGNSNTPYSGSRGPVLPNNDYAIDSIPASVNTTASLYQFLSNKYTHTGPYGGTNAALVGVARAQQWDRTGVSFIVNTILGRTGPGVRNLTAADWTILQQRLSAATLQVQMVDTTSLGCQNSYYQYNQDDVAYYPDCGEIRPAIVLFYQGVAYYAMFYSCANPIGNFPGLPNVYSLNPSITVSPTISEGDATINLAGKVNNTGGASGAVQWQATTFTLAPAAAMPGSGASALTPVAFYKNGATVIQSGSQAFPTNVSGVSPPLNPQVIGSYPVGTRICYTLSVQPYLAGSPLWNHSPPACVTISKSPKVQVLGSDLIVGRGLAAPGSNVVTTTSIHTVGAAATMYGSWAEYGIIPSGTVTGMASAAGYAGGIAVAAPPASPPTLCPTSLLTFTNQVGGSCVAASIGKYTLTSQASQIATRFPVTAATPLIAGAVTVDSLASGRTYTTAANAAISLSANAPIQPGKWVVINAPNADITITKDITYTNATLNSMADIPQLVIIARNIIISDAVSQVDSWLIASGTGANGRLNTCGAGGVTEATLPNATQCATQLHINGPVTANHLIMRRTAGSGVGAAAGDPAEVFNLRADAYLWATSYTSGSGRLPTVSTKELPPRF
jgi:hypothetical protein